VYVGLSRLFGRVMISENLFDVMILFAARFAMMTLNSADFLFVLQPIECDSVLSKREGLTSFLGSFVWYGVLCQGRVQQRKSSNLSIVYEAIRMRFVTTAYCLLCKNV
jgi:hypothetical protein